MRRFYEAMKMAAGFTGGLLTIMTGIICVTAIIATVGASTLNPWFLLLVPVIFFVMSTILYAIMG